MNEKKTKFYKIATRIEIIIIIMLITIPPILGAHTRHKNRLVKVVQSQIIESAKRCINEEKCPTDKITLQDLYDANYLEKMIHPITKKEYDPSSYVLITEKEIIFKEIQIWRE